nr:ribonuclease H-like domain-containing protein [Tanacetum cinerariifolium]
MLAPKPPNANVVRSMWLFRHKYHAYESLSMYKARLISNGRTQQVGIDFDTFSLVIKPATIRTILSLALSHGWPVHQFDVKNAFLNGDLFANYALHVGFYSSRCDSSLFIYQHGSEVAYLLICVDDIVLTASSTDLLRRIISSFHKEFDMTDLGALNYLGISVTCDSIGMFLSLKKYALEILKKVHMANCNLTQTPIDMESKLGCDGNPVSHPTLYRSLVDPHLASLKRVLRYVRGALDFGLQLDASIIGSLFAYNDADWAGCPTTRRSTSSYCVFWEIIYSQGQPNSNILSLDRVLKLSTEDGVLQEREIIPSLMMLVQDTLYQKSPSLAYG